MPKRIAYLGPPGTYTEDATERYDPAADRHPYPTITATAEAVRSGEVDEGVAPIENSLEGAVNETLDLLIREAMLSIRQEVLVPIRHCLLVKPGTTSSSIEVVYSHPQALGQCRRYLEATLPNARPVAALSTAGSVEQMQASDVPAGGHRIEAGRQPLRRARAGRGHPGRGRKHHAICRTGQGGPRTDRRRQNVHLLRL